MAEALALDEALRRFPLLLLDACVLISEFKRPTGRLRDINRPQRATTIVVLWEFLHGAKGALLPTGERVRRRAWLDEQGIARLRLSDACSRSFENLVNAEGPTGVVDALIAAESMARRSPVVTSNVKHFDPIIGLRYVAW